MIAWYEASSSGGSNTGTADVPKFMGMAYISGCRGGDEYRDAIRREQRRREAEWLRRWTIMRISDIMASNHRGQVRGLTREAKNALAIRAGIR